MFLNPKRAEKVVQVINEQINKGPKGNETEQQKGDQKENDDGSSVITKIASGVFCQTYPKSPKTGTYTFATVILFCPYTCLINKSMFASVQKFIEKSLRFKYFVFVYINIILYYLLF